MTYSDYSLSPEELTEYIKKGSTPKLQEIWEDLLRRIEDTSLKTEAKKKGYELKDNPDIDEDKIAYYKVISVPKASEKLDDYINFMLYPNVVCLKQ